MSGALCGCSRAPADQQMYNQHSDCLQGLQGLHALDRELGCSLTSFDLCEQLGCCTTAASCYIYPHRLCCHDRDPGAREIHM